MKTLPGFRPLLRKVLALLYAVAAPQVLAVIDDAPPELQCPTLIEAVAPAGSCDAIVTYGVTATDDSEAPVRIECSVPSGSRFPVGTTSVQCTAFDEADNQSTCEFTVRVQEAPVQLDCPADVTTARPELLWGTVATFPPPSLSSGCSPVEVTVTPASGSFFPVGATQVQVVATSGGAEVARCAFTVTVPAPLNIVWPAALNLPLVSSGSALVAHAEHALTQLDESRWFKVRVQPGARLVVTLTGLPANYDLVLFRDIAAAYRQLVQPSDLPLLDAEFADDAFAPAQFSPAQFSPAQFSPAAFSPAQFSPAQFSPAQFSPAQFSPAQFSPAQFSPDAFAPAQFSPAQFSPAQFSPAQFSPAQFSPDFAPAQFSEEAYASAQVRSAIGISAFDGRLNEGILVNTWNENADFYIRVRGRQGAFNPDTPFTLDVALYPGVCDGLSSTPENPPGNPLPDPGTAAPPAGYQTLILTDMDRLYAMAPVDRSPLANALTALAARPEVRGYVLDVGSDPWVAFFNQQADTRKECPFAKNLVAERIRTLVNRSRTGNDLRHVVIIGSDHVIPFFRHPDQAMLGPEEDYEPPVHKFSPSEASLRGNYFLSQDRYGSDTDIVRTELRIPLPDLALGRLVETPDEILGMIQAYLETGGGVLPSPSSALVTGYDFLEDAAREVTAEWKSGAGIEPDTLITPRDLAPSDPESWTATDLAALVLHRRYDVLFLAGHFNASALLAADFVTRLYTLQLLASDVDLKHALFYSPGCHSGYNLVDPDGIPYWTIQPDWAQLAARKRMILLAGTGYQYGDTDFLEYSERLYRDFTRNLRRGSGPVTLGSALVRAKQQYLAEIPDMRGIHEKALLQVTLFGLPMAAYNLAGARIPDAPAESIVGSTQEYPAQPQSPGSVLGLHYADVEVAATLTRKTLVLKNAQYQPGDASNLPEYTAAWYEGGNGVSVNPAEPVLPLEVRDVSVPNLHLRGIGFRGGSYVDETGVTPLTGAATTEIRGVHPAFLSPEFFPSKFWRPNYFGQFFEALEGGTRLMVTPAQVRTAANSNVGVIRRFPTTRYRLFYSSNIQTYQEGDGPPSTPALSGPPTIARVDTTVANGRVYFAIQIIGNPAAGIQEAWILYTATEGPFHGAWRALDLVRSADSRIWVGELALGSTPASQVRFTVQAVNGVGLVAFASNLGAGFIPGATDEPEGDLAPSALELLSPPGSAAYGRQIQLQARLTSSTGPLAGQLVRFKLGGLEARAVTGPDGIARTPLNLLLPPGNLTLLAAFDGTAQHAPSSQEAPFSLTRAPVRLDLSPATVVVPPRHDQTLAAVLAATGDASSPDQPLLDQPVVFVLRGPQSEYVAVVNTDYLGQATLGPVPLPVGNYSVEAYFGQAVPVPPDGALIGSPSSRYQPATSALGSLVIDEHTPTANDDDVVGQAGAALKIPIAQLLANDTDPDGDTLTLSGVDAATGRAVPIQRSGDWLLISQAAPVTDAFNYSVVDATGRTASARVVIRLQTDQAATSNILDLDVQESRVNIRFAGIPGRRYRVEFSPSASPPEWRTLGTATVRNDGTATFSGPEPGTSGFYRTAYP